MGSTKTSKGKGGGTAVAEKPVVTATPTPTEGQSTITWPTSPEERSEFEAKMERELGDSSVAFMANLQQRFDDATALATRYQADAAAYKSLLDHLGQAGR